MLSEGVRGVDNVFYLKDGTFSPECYSLRGRITWSDKRTLPQES
jgi:hypothetical protein